MNIFKTVITSVGKFLKWEAKNQKNALINADRVIDSELGGPVDYTLSGEAGKHRASDPIAAATADVLDKIQKNHVENANAVDAALTDTRKNFKHGT